MSTVSDSLTSDPEALDLPAVLDDAWRLLELGVTDRTHGFHLPVLATTDSDGHADARTVVLRGADRHRRVITCHTDARSPKIIHMTHQPWASWVLYDAPTRAQVRAAGRTQVLCVGTSEIAHAAWEKTSLNGRRCYLAPHAPTAPADSPSPNLPASLQHRQPTVDESEVGVTNFRVIATEIAQLDWLRLRHDGHLRARFTWSASGDMGATWLQP